MKVFFTLFAVMASFFGYSQNTNPKYYNNIEKVGKIETNNSQVNIKQADKVIVTINVTHGSNVFLSAYKQEKDTSGIYITYMYFTNPDEISSEINLMFKFDKPVLGGKLTFPKGTGGSMAINSNYSTDKMIAQYRGTVGSENGFIAYFVSNEKINISIKGIAGVKKI